MQRIIQRFWFKFPSDILKAAYFEVKKDSKENLLKLLIILSIYSSALSVATDIENERTLHTILKFLIIAMCLLIWKYGRRIKTIRDIFLVAFPIGMTTYSILQMKEGIVNYKPLDIYHLGICNGINNKIIRGGHPDFWTKVFLSLATLALRLTIIPISAHSVIFVELATIIIDLLGELWLEKDNRCLFKKYTDYREELTKFKNLLVSGLPVNISILSRDLRRTLFANECFKTSFKTSNPTNPSEHWNPADYFSDFAVEKESLSFGENFLSADDASYKPNLLQMLQKFCEIFCQGESEAHCCFVVKSQVMNDSNPKIFEVKVFTFIWDGEDAIAIILNDVTQQYTNMALRVADTNKDKMLSMVSHELRTPLNGILGMVSILEKQITDVQMLEYLSVCKNSGKLLLSLVNSILDLGQIRNNKFKLAITSGNLKGLVNEILLLFESQFKEKGLFLQLDVAKSDMPETVVTDLNRLKQILINLIGNALKFTFQGGVQVFIFTDENYEGDLFFSVSDSGVGIKKEDQEKLFKMYGRLDQPDGQNSEGVGLGLTISNHLVKLLSGQDKGIKVESEYENGTTFSFSIKADYNKYNMKEHNVGDTEGNEQSQYSNLADTPSKILNYIPKRSRFSFDLGSKLRRSSSSSAQVEDEYIQTPSKNYKRRSKKRHMHYLNPSLLESDQDLDQFLKEIRGKGDDILELGNTVLVVDDSPFNIMVVRHLLENLGYEVQSALNGKLGVNIVKEYSLENKRFLMILMDLQMPVMDGYEAANALSEMIERGEIPRTPIVALSANDSENDKQRCKDVGMMDHLAKPIDEKSLRMILQKFIKEKH